MVKGTIYFGFLIVVLFSIQGVCGPLGTTKHQQKLYAYCDTNEDVIKYGYKSASGDIILPAQYHFALTPVFQTMAFVVLNGEWVGINAKGEVILKPYVYDNGPDYLSEGLFRFVANNKIGFADSNGSIVIPARYNYVTPFTNGKAQYYYGGNQQREGEHWLWVNAVKQGFINRKGRELNR